MLAIKRSSFRGGSSTGQKPLVRWLPSSRARPIDVPRAPPFSGGLMSAQSLFESSPYRGIRRVIDVSGDGANNDRPLVTLIRDEVLAKGITINGLPIMLSKPNLMNVNVEGLDIYYRDCVIGGPGAFVIPIKEREKVSEAIRNKLVLEVAGRMVAPQPIAAVWNATRISC